VTAREILQLLVLLISCKFCLWQFGNFYIFSFFSFLESPVCDSSGHFTTSCSSHYSYGFYTTRSPIYSSLQEISNGILASNFTISDQSYLHPHLCWWYTD